MIVIAIHRWNIFFNCQIHFKPFGFCLGAVLFHNFLQG